MHARVTFAQVKPADIEDFARLFEDGIIPAAREEEVFRGALFLVRDDGTVMAITSPTASTTCAPTRSTGSTKQRSRSPAPLVGHPDRELFRVAVSKGIQGGVELLQGRQS